MLELNGLDLAPPGQSPKHLRHLLLDFNGTLAVDGKLLPGVATRLQRLARLFVIEVLTADTFGSAAETLAELPVKLTLVGSGREKLRRVHRLGAAGVVAIGNGRNDAEMLEASGLSIAVIGAEGLAREAANHAQILAGSVQDALDLLLRPRRLLALLRD
jgi:Soluble P-type ATPase